VLLRFFIDPATGEPHIAGHNVSEQQVEDVLTRPLEDRPGSEGSRVALGQSEAGWKVPPIPAEVFNVNAADRDWVNRQCTMQPLATFEQRIRLSGGGGKIPQVTFVLAKGFVEGSPFPPFYDKAKSRGWKTITVPCGHDVMLDLPDELTGILVDVASEQAFAV
jgi:hypothetical protein